MVLVGDRRLPEGSARRQRERKRDKDSHDDVEMAMRISMDLFVFDDCQKNAARRLVGIIMVVRGMGNAITRVNGVLGPLINPQCFGLNVGQTYGVLRSESR